MDQPVDAKTVGSGYLLCRGRLLWCLLWRLLWRLMWRRDPATECKRVVGIHCFIVLLF
jgi:hypothetical protein